jgi:hypothetical protein
MKKVGDFVTQAAGEAAIDDSRQKLGAFAASTGGDPLEARQKLGPEILRTPITWVSTRIHI